MDLAEAFGAKLDHERTKGRYDQIAISPNLSHHNTPPHIYYQ
jgi:hypothetical protein